VVSNGRLPGNDLTTVQGSIQLSDPTAKAWKYLVAAAAKHLGRHISIAAPAGGYRSYAVQAQMRQVSISGNAAQKRYWGLSTTSTAPLAVAGNSKHGLGICVDVVGTPMDGAFLSLARQYGFNRTVAGDPNHFQHDGRTAISDTPPIDFRKLARYLNDRGIGPVTATERNGTRDKAFWTSLQKTGHADGLYPVPQYRIDGDPGDDGSRTRWLAHHYWEKIR
jgi:hypothetical protein